MPWKFGRLLRFAFCGAGIFSAGMALEQRHSFLLGEKRGSCFVVMEELFVRLKAGSHTRAR